MTELSEQQTKCARCKTDYSNDRLELLIIGDGDVCQSCEAELSGKYADGQGNALDDLIAAARDLRQASADYTNGSDKGEIYYAERISGPVDLLIDALNSYERGGK